MTNSYSITPAELRRRCNNVSSVIWSDAALTASSGQWEADAHKRLGKGTTAYVLATEPNEYKIMQLIIKEGVASEVLSGLDAFREDGKQALINYYSKIKMLKSGRLTIIAGGPNLTDELDPVNYTQEATENV